MKIKLPWPFTSDLPGPRTTPNLPTPEGAELGRELARLADSAYASSGRDTRCEDCAFRLGTTPNQCAPTLMDAIKCVAEGVPFNCHVTDRPCGGWVGAREKIKEARE